MKIFLDTADVAAIKQWASTGIIDGITTNPSLLSKFSTDPKKTIQEMCAILPHGEISVEVTEEHPDKVYEQAKKIAALHKQVIVKIPCHISYYPIIKKLVEDEIPLNITLVFTVIQALMMSKLGVRYISPFVGRWDDIDVDGIALLQEVSEMRDTYGLETQILAASLRTVRQLHDAIAAGVDVATVPVAVLEKAVQHPLTDKGIDLFNADWKKLGSIQFP
jgi:transaldolase